MIPIIFAFLLIVMAEIKGSENQQEIKTTIEKKIGQYKDPRARIKKQASLERKPDQGDAVATQIMRNQSLSRKKD